MPVLNAKDTDFFFERRTSLSEAAQSITALVTTRLPGYLKYPEAERLYRSVRNIQVLAPSRKGECGVNNLNLRLQEVLNPPAADKPQFTWGETVFRLGDKVIQTRNDYRLPWRRETPAGYEEGAGVFNGDVGFIIDVDAEDHMLTVRFDEDREAT